MSLTPINPESLGAPSGYANGMLAPAGGRLLFVAGQVGSSAEGVPGETFVQQFEQALNKIAMVVGEAGGRCSDIANLTIFVTDKSEYLSQQKLVGVAYRNVMGRHFPAMALIEISGLVEEGCKLEIQAQAVIP